MADTNAQPVSIQISCNLPFPLYTCGSYEVGLADSSVNVTVKHVKQETFDRRLGIAEGDFDLKTDRTGIAGYASLEINASWESFEKIRLKTRTASPRDFAQLVVNKVIDSYRHATRTPWIRRVNADELFQLNCLTEFSSGQSVRQLDKVFPGGGVVLPRAIQKGSEEFVRRLASDNPVDIWDTLWLDCEDAIATGDTRSAVIFGHSAIETFANATVLAWAREQGLTVRQTASRFGRTKNEKRRLRESLSIDELVEFLNDTRKVDIALPICGADKSWGFDLCSRFEYLAADRNKTLHAGVIVSEGIARDHMEAVRALHRCLSRDRNLERIRDNQTPASAIRTLTELLGKQPNTELGPLLAGIEAAGTSIAFWSMKHHPLGLRKDDSKAALVFNENRLDIYLQSSKGKVDDGVERELTRVLLKRHLIYSGWPCAVVNERDSSGRLTLPLLNWEAYRMIADYVTSTTIELLEINGRLSDIGFSSQEVLEIGNASLRAHVSSPDFTEPTHGEIEYYRLLICVSQLELSGVERDWCLPKVLETKANVMVKKLRRLIESCKDLGWEPSRTASTLIFVLLNDLGLFDTLGVRSGSERTVRTTATKEEVRILSELDKNPTTSN